MLVCLVIRLAHLTGFSFPITEIQMTEKLWMFCERCSVFNVHVFIVHVFGFYYIVSDSG